MRVIKDVETLGFAVANWADRGDIDQILLLLFIEFAGRKACQELRVPAMEQTKFISAAGGRLNIPGDFIELRRLTGPESNNIKTLEYVPWDYFVQESNKESAETATIFSRQGGDWYVYPAPADGETFICYYYAGFPDLSLDNTSNWLLEFSPMVYLFGALQYLAEYAMDNERAAYWEQRFNRELARVQAIADQAEHRGSLLATRKLD